MPYKYAYLFGSLLFLVYWLVIFIVHKEQRKPMLFFSFLYGFIGVVFGFVYTVDWWQPETVTGTRVGIEDFLLGFSNGGIAFSLPFLILDFISRGKANEFQPSNERNVRSVATMFAITTIVTLFLFYVVKISSFYANAIGLFVSLLYVFCQRRDLLKISLVSGLLMMILSVPVYLLTILIFPEWVQRTWMIEKLSSVLLCSVPAEDFIWYFLVGAVVSVIYPLYTGHLKPKAMQK